jgi:hypothetical protein
VSYASERAAIEGRWQTAALVATTAYEGVPFNVPTPPGSASWARLTIRDGEAFQATLGSPNSNVHRHPGVIIVQLFTPSGVGTNDARALADTAATLFRNAVFDGVHCLAASVAVIGVDGPWLQTNVSIPFYRDEFL